jgi:hypothetical protein
MAFVTNDLLSMGGKEGFIIYSYSSDDAIATINTAGYFNNIDDNVNLQAGDMILAKGSDGEQWLNVVSVSSGAVTTRFPESRALSRDLIATVTLTAADSGGVFFLNAGTEFVTTLPSPAPGLNFRFVCKAAPASASYTIVTAGSDRLIIGGINELEVDTSDDGEYDADGDVITFADGVAVVGDWVFLVSDGTSWYLTGQANADGGITVAGS